MIQDSQVEQLYELFKQSGVVTTDSRNVPAGAIFFALKGESFDGNKYAGGALEQGAAWAVVDDAALKGADDRFFVVEDVLECLQALAAHHRRELSVPILAVAGSNGKTTTKELCAAVLAKKFALAATKGNLNNHIGVPLTLLAMDESVEFGIVEMGASAQGEIALLCSIADPDYGILTNVGRAHLEGFGGEQGIRRGKGELFDFLAREAGVAFVREEDELLVQMAAEREGLTVEAFSTALSAGCVSQLEGDYNMYNIAAAVAIGEYFNVESDDIANAIAEYEPTNNRSQNLATERNQLVVDCYNANPSSMEVALSSFAERAGERVQVLILGDMLELGEWSQREHSAVVAKALESGCAKILLVGGEFGGVVSAEMKLRGVEHFANVDELIVWLQDNELSGCEILIKGSRGIRLERVIDKL